MCGQTFQTKVVSRSLILPLLPIYRSKEMIRYLACANFLRLLDYRNRILFSLVSKKSYSNESENIERTKTFLQQEFPSLLVRAKRHYPARLE